MDTFNILLKELGYWAEVAQTPIRIGIILVISWIMLSLSQKLIPLLRKQLQERTDDPEQLKRLGTLGRVFRYIAAVLITLISGMLVLAEFGVSIAPILASAGVIGIAVGFGAQSLIKDYFNGFFLLLEDQVRQGDVVEVAGKGGLVEEVTLRYIRLRDYEGNVHFVPNGIIATVTNRSRSFAYAVINIGIAYRENVEEVFEVMREVAAGMRQDETLGPMILEDIDIAGVDDWADSAVVIRCRLKVQALQQWTVRRAFLLRMKKEFDRRGIEIPFPHLTLYPGQAKDGSAPPLHILNQG